MFHVKTAKQAYVNVTKLPQTHSISKWRYSSTHS